MKDGSFKHFLRFFACLRWKGKGPIRYVNLCKEYAKTINKKENTND